MSGKVMATQSLPLKGIIPPMVTPLIDENRKIIIAMFQSLCTSILVKYDLKVAGIEYKTDEGFQTFTAYNTIRNPPCGRWGSRKNSNATYEAQRYYFNCEPIYSQPTGKGSGGS